MVPFNTTHKFLTMQGARNSYLFNINLSRADKLSVWLSLVKLMDEWTAVSWLPFGVISPIEKERQNTVCKKNKQPLYCFRKDFFFYTDIALPVSEN